MRRTTGCCIRKQASVRTELLLFKKEAAMLPSREIPQYQDDSDDWLRFLDKAAKGSIKAEDCLHSADLAYMVALTGDPESPNKLDLGEYAEQFRLTFPATPPGNSIHELIERAVEHRWFPHLFCGSETRIHPDADYAQLWKRRRCVRTTALLNDALLHCLEHWSADDCLQCLDEYSVDFNSRTIVSGMLYLSFTWPEELRS